jgi:hypothetical protein
MTVSAAAGLAAATAFSLYNKSASLVFFLL